MRRRCVYRVKPPLGKARHGWRVLTPAGEVSTSPTKRVAVSHARRWARSRWENHGELCQLVVHGRNGRIQYEHTYGRDPRRRKG